MAIVGAGGIGFDTAEYLSQHGVSSSLDQAEFNREWGIDGRLELRGGLAAQGRRHRAPRGKSICYSAKPARWAKAWGKPPVGSTAPA